MVADGEYRTGGPSVRGSTHIRLGLLPIGVFTPVRSAFWETFGLRDGPPYRVNVVRDAIPADRWIVHLRDRRDRTALIAGRRDLLVGPLADTECKVACECQRGLVIVCSFAGTRMR
jgi:hypothetical protein